MLTRGLSAGPCPGRGGTDDGCPKFLSLEVNDGCEQHGGGDGGGGDGAQSCDEHPVLAVHEHVDVEAVEVAVQGMAMQWWRDMNLFGRSWDPSH